MSARLFDSVAPEVNTTSSGSALQKGGHGGAALLQRLRGSVAHRVQGGRVAETLAEVRQHGLDHPGSTGFADW